MASPAPVKRSRWRWWLLLLLAWPAAELVSLTFLVDRIGGAAVGAIVLVTGILGVVVMAGARRRWRVVTASLRPAGPPDATSSVEGSLADVLQPGRLSDPALTFAAGFLLLLPGPIGDVVGVALLIPGVRALVAATVAVRVGRRFPQAASGLRTFRIRGSGTVVRGESWDQTPSEDGSPKQDPSPNPPPALPPGA
jgi:UPF0716 protein FxsA